MSELGTHARRPGALKFALMGLAGASIEWYDFLLYATAAALVFPRLFFPHELSPYIAQIASFSTFTVGFVARPVGAMLFGHVGDRVGRKPAFAAALVTMGLATTLIGLVPPYRTAGALAPLALVVLRIAQGLALGGQWGGATLLATESAPPARRGLYGGISQAGVPVGVLLANLSMLLAGARLSSQSFIAWGWRIPFLLSLLLVFLGAWLHWHLADTGTAGSTRAPGNERQRSPVTDALRRHPRQIFLAAGAYFSSTLCFYILVAYVVAYGTSSTGLGLPRSLMLGAVLVAHITRVPFDILAGRWSDRFGRRRVFMIGLLLMMIWGFALFPMLESRSWPLIVAAICIGAWSIAIPYGPMAALFTELFDRSVRYSAISLAYQIGAIMGGGIAPMIATGLYARYHNNLWIALYIAAACALSMICLNRLGEASGPVLDEPAHGPVVHAHQAAQ